MSSEQEEATQSSFRHYDAFQTQAALLVRNPACDLPTAEDDLVEAHALSSLCSIVSRAEPGEFEDEQLSVELSFCMCV